MNNSDKPVANPIAVLREEFDDWAVLFNPDTAQAFGTNPTGVFIWKLLDGKKSVEEICAAVQERFADTPETAGFDTRKFIEDLTARGFVGCEMK